MAKNSGLSKAKNAKKMNFILVMKSSKRKLIITKINSKIKPYYVTVMIRLRVISVNFFKKFQLFKIKEINLYFV